MTLYIPWDFKKIIKKFPFLRNISFLKNIKITRELSLIGFFWVLFFILIIRLGYLQIIEGSTYDTLLNNQHFSQSLLKAKRWNIYVMDSSWKPIKLTENIDFFNIFIDPKYVTNKTELVKTITPLVYKHLCSINGFNQPTNIECIKNIEIFTNQEILPKAPEIFYYGSWIISTTGFDFSWFNQKTQTLISGFSTGIAYDMINKRLDQRIQIGIKEKNYVGFLTSPNSIEALKRLNLAYIDIQDPWYVFIIPTKVDNRNNALKQLQTFFNNFNYQDLTSNLPALLVPQENRYVKILSDVNPQIAKEFQELKIKYLDTKYEWIPLFHGLWLEQYTRRYYPYETFMANILGYVDQNDQAYYGVEKFFDDQLRGKDGKIVGRSSARVGSSEFNIINQKDGNDIFLTIDPTLQKHVEWLLENRYKNFKADSISAVVIDPYNGQVKASANYPTYNPNNYNDVYTLQPLGPEQWYILDDQTRIDTPVFIKTGNNIKVATLDERYNTILPKYISKNILWPQVFIDKIIAFPYEPGSIFKAFTFGIAIDSDEITMYDFYEDKGKIEVWPYTISNVDKACLGNNTFLHALQFSCNVGMVRIAQKIQMQNFYNYLDKLGFGKTTNIELDGEDPWFVEDINTVSKARYFNNAFWQGLLTTPLQIVAWYSTLVNGWYVIQPTIVNSIYDRSINETIIKQKKIWRQIFKPITSEFIKEALFKVVDNTVVKKFSYIPGYTLGGKSGTSQISFKGKYKKGVGWTNGSFVGIITKDNLKYVVLVQVRRPRSNQWWEATAGLIFHDIAKFLISYQMIEK